MNTVERTPERLEMVKSQIAARGIEAPILLEAMKTIPREEFLPLELAAEAYADKAVSVGHGQTISQPYIVAFMTDALELTSSHRVLEIGTGTGYQTSILAMLSSRVYTMERIEDLSTEARQRLGQMDLSNIDFRVGDGSLGWPEQAPFDRIIVTAGAPQVPSKLFDQLTETGVLVIPVGDEHSQRLVRIHRSDGRFIEKPLLHVRFVRLIGADAYSE